MDGGAWKAAVHGVAEGQTRLSDFTFTCHFDALEKEMATHSSVPAWRIPGTGEPGRLLFMGLHRVRHDWSDLNYNNNKVGLWQWNVYHGKHPKLLLWRTKGRNQWVTFLQSNKRIRPMAVSPDFQFQGTGLDCCTSWYLFPSTVDKP